MCRLTLNALLLKYVGVTVTIGEDEAARAEYIQICKIGSKGDHTGDPGYLASLVLSEVEKGMLDMEWN